jgi:3-oxoacyl-[acyl-carrier protein] reductase
MKTAKLLDKLATIVGGQAREAVAPLAAEGANIAAVPCDVMSERDLARAVQECLDRFGRVDVLVHNAGVTRDGYIGKLSEAGFDLVVGVSLKGAWLGTRAVAPLLRQQGSAP